MAHYLCLLYKDMYYNVEGFFFFRLNGHTTDWCDVDILNRNMSCLIYPYSKTYIY